MTDKKGTLTPLAERVDAVMWPDKPREHAVNLYGPGTPCPLHGKPLGPAPARNCEDCRAGIDRLLS